MDRLVIFAIVFFASLSFDSFSLGQQTFNVQIDGPDAIFLAGRTDVRIPPASEPWNGPGTRLIRHGSDTPEEALESLPPSVPVEAGDIIRALDPASGGINFFLGFGPPFFGPSGNGLSGSNLGSLDGISGYQGPEGPLAGVFLSDAIPDSDVIPPPTLDFRPGGIGVDFESLEPELGQVFYIGDGVTKTGMFQEFVAPLGATRLFLAIPDGFGFDGPPGAYDDNDGSYQIVIAINEIPELLGDLNCDGLIDLLDVQPFVEAITNSDFINKADVNQDNFVDLLDVDPFVDLLTN